MEQNTITAVSQLTTAELRKMQMFCREKAIALLVVRTKKQAIRFNQLEADMMAVFPTYHGHNWQKGDRYYLFLLQGGLGEPLAEYGPVPE